ncbi:hypothetical protein KR200_005486 [Drosophila serrata]|nr:hypothetical protein KR200_005486 [Drosophila serrata]
MSQQNNETSIALWREFFKLYRSMPELWLMRSKSYRNRRLKDESYGRLLTLMRQIDPNANCHSLKRKINNFRTSYRRELRKVLRSGYTYVPGLWYFKDLDFLCEMETGVLQYDGSMEKEPEMDMDMEPEPEPLAQQNQEYEQQVFPKVEALEGITENMGVNEINDVSTSSSFDQENHHHHHHQVVVHNIHHIGSGNEDDDIFAETFNKEEDVLGGMEPGSEGEAEPEPYLDTEADADPDLATEPIISGRHRTDAKGITNDFHDSTSNRSRSGSREGHDLDKSSRSNMRRVRTRRRSSNNASDYEESSRKPQGKRQRIKEDPSPDRNRDRVIDRDSDSECELIGKRMAAHFRNMRTDQRLFAERIISEVLVFGRMNRLSFDSQFIPNRKED